MGTYNIKKEERLKSLFSRPHSEFKYCSTTLVKFLDEYSS